MAMLNTTSPLPVSDGPAPVYGPVEGHQAIITAPAQLRLTITPRAPSKDPSTRNSLSEPIANAQKYILHKEDSPRDGPILDRETPTSNRRTISLPELQRDDKTLPLPPHPTLSSSPTNKPDQLPFIELL